MDIFLISPVRLADLATTRELGHFVDRAETGGNTVHLPARGANQDDDTGLNICHDNLAAIRRADEVWVWYSPDSQGILFDLGMAFALGKTIRLVGPRPERTPHKSLANVLLAISTDRRAP